MSIVPAQPPAAYVETHTVATNDYGLVNLVIGQGTAQSGVFADIDWANGPYWAQLEADITGGTNYVTYGSQQLMSVPYALYAETSGQPGVAGPTGPAGPQGPTGANGVGATGPQGPQGPAGADGADGATGPQGPTGAQGVAGNDGATGATGPQGPTGLTGAAGADGATGPQGPQGPTGNDGLDGAQGPAGPQGPAGNDGLDGAQGPAGPQGPAGNDGADGAQGPAGPQGPAGNDGLDGAQGPVGPQGLAGADGADGAVGPQGPVGPAGADGQDGADGAVGPQGPAGNDGADGAQGPAGPQGPAGNDGADGAQGPAGPQGPAGNDGLDGAQGPVGPQGLAGADGADGAVGPQGPVGPAGADGQDGADGAVGPQGPAGNDGADGAQGPAGPQGLQGAQGVTGPQGPTGATGLVNPGNNQGDLTYWNGQSWEIVPAPSVSNVVLTFCQGLPIWTVNGSCPVQILHDSVYNPTYYEVSSSFSVVDDGDNGITSVGLCWSTTVMPTVNNSDTVVTGSSLGQYQYTIENLTPNTTYYIRPFAQNSTGFYYGGELMVNTLEQFLPDIVTVDTIAVLSTTVQIEGHVLNDGGAPIVYRGFCWSLLPDPTIANDTVINIGSTGLYSSSIDQLDPETTYYIRAYGTNSVGTSYGNSIVVTTDSISEIQIGEFYQGGIVAHIFTPGQAGYIEGETHGIIAAPFDQSSSKKWNCVNINITALSTAIGQGGYNTNRIMNRCASNGPAGLCFNLNLNGYSDWVCPSPGELGVLYTNRNLIGGFANANYWSSYCGSNYTVAVFFSFASGSSSGGQRTGNCRVRAIRYF